MSQLLGVTWYRFRATFRQRWRSDLAIVLLIGLVGGVALGSLAAGRRTAGSFSVYLASTNPSDLSFEVIPTNGNGLDSAALTGEIARLPHVKHVETGSLGLEVVAVNSVGLPAITPRESNVFDRTEVVQVGSVSGLYFNQDRVTVVQGSLANPNSDDEAVLTPEAAQLLGWHVGEELRVGLFSAKQLQQAPSPNALRTKPRRVIELKLVGLVVFNDAVVQDDVNRYPTDVLLTPALTREVIATSGPGIPLYGLQLDGGSRYIPEVEQEINAIVPPSLLEFHVTSLVSAEAQRTIEPEAVALAVFGGIASLATLLIAGQAIGRLLRERDEDLRVLRALGADPKMTTSDGLVDVLGAVVVGALVAIAVAVVLSPLAPIGPARAVYPSRGMTIDWTVVGPGVAVLVVGLGALALALAYRGRPQSSGEVPATGRGSGVLSLVTGRLSVPAATGLHFAFAPGRARNAAPVRSALFATALAVVMVVATLTFGNSLGTLVSSPALYGWNWSYAIQASGGYGDVPLDEVQGVLNANHFVAASAAVAFVSVELDGQTVPVLFGTPHAPVAPPILSGHGLDASNEIVLGSATLAALHKVVGDTVSVSYGQPKDAPAYLPRTTLRIVGTATMPAIGTPQGLHASMGIGALAPYSLFGPLAQQGCIGPSSVVLVRLRAGVPPSEGLRSMQATSETLSKKFAGLPASNSCSGESIALLSVQHPAEIVNYRSMGGTPAILASAVAAAAVIALGLTLAASVRRRRRNLALLKTLGFTRRQLATTVSWQASFVSLVGIAIGIPVGIALGRWLWTAFARQIDAVPEPAVPLLAVVLVGIAAVIFANVVAAIPGQIAARTPAALALRAE